MSQGMQLVVQNASNDTILSRTDNPKEEIITLSKKCLESVPVEILLREHAHLASRLLVENSAKTELAGALNSILKETEDKQKHWDTLHKENNHLSHEVDSLRSRMKEKEKVEGALRGDLEAERKEKVRAEEGWKESESKLEMAMDEIRRTNNNEDDDMVDVAEENRLLKMTVTKLSEKVKGLESLAEETYSEVERQKGRADTMELRCANLTSEHQS